MITIIKPDSYKLSDRKSHETDVIVHDGLFHADEVFSVALLMLFYKNINVVRTRNKELLHRAVSDPKVFVLDVGNAYNPEMLNFDHHQQDAPKGLSTVSMIFSYLFPDYTEDPVMKKVFERLIWGINQWDQGKADRISFDNSLHLPQLISAFNRPNTRNQDIQFLKAVEFAHSIIANEINTAREINKAGRIWNKKELLNNRTALLYENCAFWRTIQGEEKPIHYIVQPGHNNWMVVSVDNVKYPLPKINEKTKGLIFQHKNRFITVFEDYKTAISYANKHLITK